MVNPTDELCAKLDELGIKYTIDDSDDYEIVEWQGPYNLWWQFVYDPYDGEPYGELRLLETGSTHLTPKQAIAATVGERNPDGLPIGLTISNDGNLLNWMGENYVRQDAAKVGVGTCELINAADDLGEGTSSCMCSKCGYTALDDWWDEFKHCPNCGRRIEVSE